MSTLEGTPEPTTETATRHQSAPGALAGLRVAALVSNEGVEESELVVPVQALRDRGALVEIVAPDDGSVQAVRHLDRAGAYPVDRTLDAVAPEDYDALVLPGGVANADALRTKARAVEFARDFADHHKPIGVICHGPWLLVEADVLRGKTITSWPSLATDIRNAGATWVDEEVCRSDNLISSRKPQDLDAFCETIVEAFASAGVR